MIIWNTCRTLHVLFKQFFFRFQFRLLIKSIIHYKNDDILNKNLIGIIVQFGKRDLVL